MCSLSAGRQDTRKLACNVLLAPPSVVSHSPLARHAHRPGTCLIASFSPLAPLHGVSLHTLPSLLRPHFHLLTTGDRCVYVNSTYQSVYHLHGIPVLRLNLRKRPVRVHSLSPVTHSGVTAGRGIVCSCSCRRSGQGGGEACARGWGWEQRSKQENAGKATRPRKYAVGLRRCMNLNRLTTYFFACCSL